MPHLFDSLRRWCGGSGVIAALILANTALFLAVWIVILVGHKLGMEGNFTISWLCVSSSPSAVVSRPWTLLTYMVTQYDFIHLLFNVLWLFWFGVFIPSSLSEKMSLRLYAGAGLAGAFCYIAVNLIFPHTNPGGYLCGASAAVLGIMAAVAAWEPKREIRLLFFGKVQMRWIALVCIALTFFGMDGGSWAAQAAHIGGAVFGLIFALIAKSKISSGAGSAHASRRTCTEAAGPRKPRRALRVNVRRDGKAVADAAEHLSDTGRLDILLDKIRISGYASLSAGERNELMLLSQRLKKNDSE